MAIQDLNAVGDVLEVRIVGDLDEQTVINTFHYVVTSIGTPGAFATMTQANSVLGPVLWDDGVDVGIRWMMSNSVGQVSLEYQKIQPLRYVPHVFDPINQVGGVDGLVEPAGCAIVVKRTSELAGRKNRGRIFVPGVPVSFVTESVVNVGGIAAATQAISQMNIVKTIPGTGGNVVITPYIFNLRAPANKQPIVDVSVNDVVCYQRRREVGRGI